METLGSLCDRLSIVNIKLWFAQEALHQADRANTGVPAEVVSKVVNLNRQRNKLMTEIDETLARAVESGRVDVDQRYKT